MLKFLEPEIVYPNRTDDTFMFYHLSNSEAKHISSVLIDIEYLSNLNYTPELFYLPETETLLNKNSKFLPMPIIKINSYHHNDL